MQEIFIKVKNFFALYEKIVSFLHHAVLLKIIRGKEIFIFNKRFIIKSVACRRICKRERQTSPQQV